MDRIILLAVVLLSPFTDALPVNGTDCNYVVTNPRGEITSPNYPGKYSANLTCSWHFECDPANYVYVVFREYKSEWGVDVLKVYDGSDDGSRLLWTHSGDGPLPGPFQSTANSLFMTFVTNESFELTGFWVSYATFPHKPKLPSSD